MANRAKRDGLPTTSSHRAGSSRDGVTASRTPAQLLVGKNLDNGWTVERLIDRPSTATGGNFSTAYIVRSAYGDKAFLKAMDYRKALESPDPASALEAMTAAYIFERTLLEKCISSNLSRIVRVLDKGTVVSNPGDPSSVVQYLIFELAEGDIRSFVGFNQAFDNAWILRTMHQASAALHQLHYAQIAHQDVKPSNVLIFENRSAKLADLGRAFDRQLTSPHDALICAGDITYAPPELLYGHVHQDWKIRRLACGIYLLGSLIVFFYTGVSITHLILKRLDRRYHYTNWKGHYDDVLPYIYEVFAQILRELRNDSPEEFSADIVDAIRQLCDPDPERRGHPKNRNRGDNRYSIERYVSQFDYLAKRAELASKLMIPR